MADVGLYVLLVERFDLTVLKKLLLLLLLLYEGLF